MSDSRKILDRISNLITEDSTILKEFDKKIDKTNQEKEKAQEEVKSLEKSIKDLQGDIDAIAKVSELTERFSNLDDYMDGLAKLGDACRDIERLNQELNSIPNHIEELENKISDLTDKKDKNNETVKNCEDELSKLSVDVSDAKRYQENLVDLIDLAKKGDINKTREEVEATLTHVGFTEKDAISAAKIILFPEDELIPFFNKETVNKEIPVEVAKEEIKEEVKEVEEEEDELEIKFNEEPSEEIEDTEDDVPFNIQLDDDTKEVDDIDEGSIVINLDEDDDQVVNLLKNNGIDYSKVDINNLNNQDFNLLKDNLEFLKDKKISNEFIASYSEVLYDVELKAKYDYIVAALVKKEEDIALNPLILISYSLDDFKKLVDITGKSGIEAKDIPLMVYIKGLQAYLQNYLTLKENNIDIESNELQKFGAVLAINPVDFKASLNTLLSYNINLKKKNGKIALMPLLRSSKELTNDIDLLIEMGEEDLVKYYPEVLSSDVSPIVNRLNFIKEKDIPYKTDARGETVYQSYVFFEYDLDEILEKHIELDDVKSKGTVNKYLSTKLNDASLIEILDNMSDDDKVLSGSLDNYVEVLDSYKNFIKEKDLAYEVNELDYSKTKVKANLNYLISNTNNASKSDLILLSFMYNTYRNEDDVNNFINILNLEVK